jgi:uncharacterized protein (TIGR02246 family)
MAAETKQSIDNEGQIRELIDTLLAAESAKDVEGSLAPYITDVVSYDLIDPLQYNGVDTIRERLNQWFSSFEGPIGIEFRDLEVTAGDDVAFCNGLHHVNGTKTDGEKLEMWWRTTLCLRKIDGSWTITHSHDSVPFNMNTGMASLDLKP